MNPSTLPSPYPGAGEVIDGKYQIEKVLGEGGMGCVAKAFHLLLRAPVALKFMNPQFMSFPGAVERFINEGIASKRIRSDHVVPVDDVGKLSTGAPYLVMPCLEGLDLADLLARDGKPGLDIPRAVHFTLQILRGLQAAHASAIIHRDMKPSNCFVVKHEGEGDFVRILDFGISKVTDGQKSASLTQTNSALGTPLYMSPEQARSPRDVDGRSDLYSVGVIVYELLTGATPFFSESGEFTEILFKLFTSDPPPIREKRPEISEGLAEVVHKALAREVENRYSTAAEMAAALAPFADERSAHVIARIAGFRPEHAASLPPPENIALPPSLLAFSNLDVREAKPATDIMPNRPTTDVMRHAPVTALLENAPKIDKLSDPQISTKADVRHSATPAALENRAMPHEASARTQMGDQDDAIRKAVVPGVQTDLGASRDASQGQIPAASRQRSPAVYILPAIAALAVGSAGFFIISKKLTTPETTGKPDPAVTVTAVTAPPPPVSAIPLVPVTAPSQEPSAKASETKPLAPPPTQQAATPPNTNNKPPGGKSALDTKPHLE